MSSRLASLLVQDGHVTAPRMAEAFQRQVIYGGALDTILLEMGVVDEERVVEYLGRAAELPPVEPDGGAPSANAPMWFPRSVAEQFLAAPVQLTGRVARVMVGEAVDRHKLDELKTLLGLDLVAQVAPEFRVHQALERHYGIPTPARFAALARKLKQRAGDPSRSRRPPRREVRVMEAEPADESESRPAPAEAAPATPPAEPAPPEPAPREPAPAEPVAAAPASEAATPIDEDTQPGIPSIVSQSEWDAPPEQTQPARPRAIFTRSDGVPEPIAPEVSAERSFARPIALPDGRATTPLPQPDGLQALHDAEDREEVLEILCRMARARFAFAAAFTVQGDAALPRMALGDRWLEPQVIGEAKVRLDTPSSFRAAINGRAPYLGRIDDDPPTSQAMAMLGRKHELWGALLPVVIRDRTVALLHVDDAGKVHESNELGELIIAVTEAAQSFQRLILRAKAGKLSKPAAAPAVVGTLNAGVPAAPDELRKVRRLPSMQLEDEPSTDPGYRRAMKLEDWPPAEAAAALLEAVIRGGSDAHAASDQLVSLGEPAAVALARAIPGPLRLDRHALPGNDAPPARDHGPLLALLPRFGRTIVPHLASRLGDPSLDVRWYATMAFTELRFPEAVEPLGRRLFDADPTVRRAAAAVLSRFEPSPELRALLEGLRGELIDPSAAKQRHAAEAVGELRDAPSVPRLIELVKHREGELVEAARRALVQITKQDFGTSRWRWRSWWDRHRSQSRIEWLLAGLAHRDAAVRSSASDELQALTSDYFGYHNELSKRDREEAKEKWAAWSKLNPGGRERSKGN